MPALMVTPSATYRLVKDHLGSVRFVTNVATGAVVQELRYDAWGRVLVDTNPGLQPFGFAGGLYEEETGLVRFGARDYDAGSGRWTAKDPIRFGGGPNLSGYVEADPVNQSDPLGLLARLRTYWPGIRQPSEPLIPQPDSVCIFKCNGGFYHEWVRLGRRDPNKSFGFWPAASSSYWDRLLGTAGNLTNHDYTEDDDDCSPKPPQCFYASESEQAKIEEAIMRECGDAGYSLLGRNCWSVPKVVLRTLRPEWTPEPYGGDLGY